MKKPIDPNLSSGNDDDLLLELSGTYEEKKGLHFAEGSEPGEIQEPDFSVSVDTHEKGTIPGEPIASVPASSDISAIVDKDETENEEHHHHHHHHSSSSHHSSSHHSSSHHSSSHHSSSHHSSSHHHHHSSSHHGSKEKKKRLPVAARIAIIILVILFLVPIFSLIFLGINVKTGEFKKDNAADTEYVETIEYNGHTYKYNEDIVSIAFIGVDQEELKTTDETDFVGAADADIVFAVNTKTGKASAIAIPRDTMVDVDRYLENGTLLRSEKMQLCLAYAYGDGAELSCTNTVSSISRVLYNVPINKYFVLDLSGISALNDAIGGVTIDSSLYEFKDEGISVGDKVVLKGDMAETYVRKRDMDNVNASLNRTDRQVQYIKAYTSQAVPAVMKNFGILSDLYTQAQKYSQTDLEFNNVTYLASLLLSKGVTTFDTYTLKGTMSESADPVLKDVAHAEFTPDEDYLMQTVLNVFYTQVD